MTGIMSYHQMGELRLMFDRRVAKAVINAYRAHGEIVCVDPTTGAEVPGRPHVDDRSYVDPEVWVGMVRVAGEYQERLETIDQLHDVRARLARMAAQEKKRIKEGKKVVEHQQQELLQAQKQHDAAAQGQIGYFIRENMKQIDEFMGLLQQHQMQMAMCDDVLQRI